VKEEFKRFSDPKKGGGSRQPTDNSEPGAAAGKVRISNLLFYLFTVIITLLHYL
jgi:hypothetical protein